MPFAPFVNNLWSSDSKALGDLMSAHEIIDVNFSPHEIILGNPCHKVADVRTHLYLVSTNILT